LASEGLIELHRNAENLGFIGACNLAMGLHGERDIVLLNSDTEVYGDWLDRLRDAAFSEPNVATVTPFSNNAEICSYPHFVQDNWWRLELPDAELDALAAEVNAGVVVPIPTGVGFCLYIQRACLDQIGLFDGASFGKGYGEENDLCRRAAEAGWSNMLAPNIFVRHYGGSSFGASKDARVLAAIRMVEELHPGYGKLVGDFITSDPIANHRRALDVGRVARLSRQGARGAILFITHSWGGGTERHVQELCRLTAAAGVSALIGRVDPTDHEAIVLEVFGQPEFPNLPRLSSKDGVEVAAGHLKALGVSHVHVHHLAGYAERMSDFIVAIAAEATLDYDVTLHDYVAVCPRITLIDQSDIYCGEPDLTSCESCIAYRGSPFGHPPVWDWRARHARLLRGARKIFVPSTDAARRMSRYLPDLAFAVRPHPEEVSDPGPQLERSGGAKRRVALLGAIGPHKGSVLLAEVVKAAQANDLPLEFVLVGYSDRNDELLELGVDITGPYKEGDGARLLRETKADLVWFASVWPETYSYTLSDAFAAGVMPVAFDLGAVADRIRQAGFGHLMPIDLLLDPTGIAVTLATLSTSTTLQTPFAPAQYADLLADYYELA
jgi:glycosyltransferase involved in cell wall biosynthesis